VGGGSEGREELHTPVAGCMGCQIARTVRHHSTTTAHQLTHADHSTPYVTCDTWTLPTRPQEPPQRALESGVWSRDSARAVWQPFIANSHGPLLLDALSCGRVRGCSYCAVQPSHAGSHGAGNTGTSVSHSQSLGLSLRVRKNARACNATTQHH
jgi:hypothetical protein